MIKTMNIKMTTNSQLSTTEPQNKNKSKLSKEPNRITEMETTWRVFSWEGEEGEWGKCVGIKKNNL